jgi:hypothetical protein
MTERGSGWKASLDGVVSDFDEVTRHLRHRQRQALRVAWSVVAASGLGLGALILLNLAAAGHQSAPITASPSLSLLEPRLPSVLTSPGIDDTAPPATVGTAPVSLDAAPGATRRPTRHLLHVPAPVALTARAVPAEPVTTAAPPAAPPAQPPAAPGLVDGLVGGVLHLVG